MAIGIDTRVTTSPRLDNFSRENHIALECGSLPALLRITRQDQRNI